MEKPELAQIGNENQTVLLKVADDLRVIAKSVEVVVRGFDFNYTTFGVLEDLRFSITTLAIGLREEATVGHAGALVAKLGREKDCGLQILTRCIEESVEWRVEGRLGSRGTGRPNGSQIGEVLRDAVGRGHAPFIIAQSASS